MRVLLLLVAAVGCSDRSRPVEPPEQAAGTTTATAPEAPPVPTPVEAARAAIARACARGDARACMASGKPDDACVHGDAGGCLAMAERGGPGAAIYLARACRRGSAEACGRLPERPEEPRLTAPGLGSYRHAVLDCWAETDGIDRHRAISGTIALTSDLDGRTTAIARLDHDGLRRCVETSASRWVVDGNRDVELTIRPRSSLDDRIAVLGSLQGGGSINSILGSGGGGGVVGGIIGADPGGGGLGVGRLGGSGGGAGVGGLGFGLRKGQLRSRVRGFDDTLERSQVERKVRSIYSYGVKRCYQRALAADPKLETEIRLRFTVTPSGAVDNVRATSTGPDELRRCVKDRANLWRFRSPEADDGRPATARFEVSLTLSPR